MRAALRQAPSTETSEALLSLLREIGDLKAGAGILDRRMFSYVRYNAQLTRAGLDGLGLPDVRPADVQRMDSVQHIGDLQRIGMRLVALRVLVGDDGAHFLSEPEAA